MNVTVYQTVNKSGTIRTVKGTSPGTFAMLNIDQKDILYVGGAPINAEVWYFLFATQNM